MASPSKLENLKTVHVIGVCGTLMGAFAAFMKRRGLEVTGSDQNVYPPMSDVLAKAGVKLFSGYSAENLSRLGYRPDLVVIGNVISANNPEARAAIDGGYAYSSLPEAMENFMLRETTNLVVAGTHGKTTTSSLLAHVLVECGRDPSYFIGGVSQDLPFSFHVSQSHGESRGAGQSPFVLEGDEYDTAFWDKVPKFNHYLPDQVILTSVEFDHADIYADLAAVERAFEGLVDRIRPGGSLIACTDYSSVRKLLARAKVPVTTYGSEGSAGARFTPARIRSENERLRFSVLDAGREVAELELSIPGNHNALNATAVWMQATRLGLSTEQVARALASFQGVKRRQEVRGEVQGVMVIDDFAHHPTAVRETLKALRGKYPRRRLVAVFEPRSATSRRKVFQKDYADAFGQADATFIAVPYDQTKISADNQFSSDQLVSDISRAGRSGHLMASVEEGVRQVASFAREGDLVAVLSNGGFGGFIPKLLEALGKGR
jgi:UDP-N-acetylmuramate: L-alanyl-gamma-D-glutamyl-meso-diaminopimelate ligase